jgi:CheY-like chemotaxis protein
MTKARESLPELIVDDHHLIAGTLALILSDHGLETTSAYIGEEAVDAATIRMFRFREIGIVVTDVLLGIVTATGLFSDFMRSRLHESNLALDTTHAEGEIHHAFRSCV